MRMTLNNANQWLNNQLFANINLPATIDKVTLSNFILDEYGDYKVREYDPDIFKRKIETWFQGMRPNFEKIDNALSLEYNPIENYDRKEDTTSNRKQQGSLLSQVSAFDSTTLSDANKDVSDNTNNDVLTSHVHGNVGVTKSQDMLKDEVNVRTDLNIYTIIADAFFDKWLIHVL